MSGVPRSVRALVAGSLLAMPLLLVPVASTAAADELLRMSARVLLQGHVRVGSWMSVEVQLANDGPPIVGELRIDTLQNGARYSMAVDLPTSSRKTYVLHAQPPPFGHSLNLSLVANKTAIATVAVPYQVHTADQMVIGVVAERPQGITARLRIASNTGVGSASATLATADLPDRVEGWAPLDALIWQDTDSNELSAEQLTAMRAWLAGGGRLVIVGGTAGIGTLSAFPDDLLPYRPTATVEIDPASVAGVVGPAPEGAADFTAMAGSLARGHALATVGDRAVTAVASYGNGSVAIVGFDPSTSWLLEGQAAATLWQRLIPQRVANGTVIFDDSQLLQGVISLPSLALPPIGGLLLLLAGYILVIGPLNYLVLRRLDRRELAWVTMPVLILGFAAGAYGYGAVLRGTDIVVNEVAIVRGALDTTVGAAQAYFGVFSPTRGTYQVEVPGGALLAGPLTPEAIGGTSGMLDVLQGDPSSVRDLAIGFGSLRVVRAETTATVPLMRAALHLADGELSGTFENGSDQTLEKVAVVMGSSVATLGDVKPHTTVPVKVRLTGLNLDRSLADWIIGQFGGGPVAATEDLSRQAARYQMVNQLAYDPMMGWGNRLPGERPVILAFGRSPVLDVKVQGQQPHHASNVMYYVPADMTIEGSVAFGGDLIRSTVVAVDNPGFFSKDPYNIYMGAGTMTSAYQPIDFPGDFELSEIRFLLTNNGPGFLPASGKVIEPLATIPELCTDVTNTKPEGCKARRGDLLPEVELFDVEQSQWARLPALANSTSYRIADPERYYSAAGRQVLVRFVNPDPQNQIGFSFQLVMAGLVR
ncbi:MAG: hypothetical protein ACAH65_05445 [Chloroflexota bacterium]